MDWHYYSVPYQLTQQLIEVRLAERTVGAVSWDPLCAQAVTHILDNKPHPEQGYRACLGEPSAECQSAALDQLITASPLGSHGAARYRTTSAQGHRLSPSADAPDWST